MAIIKIARFKSSGGAEPLRDGTRDALGEEALNAFGTEVGTEDRPAPAGPQEGPPESKPRRKRVLAWWLAATVLAGAAVAAGGQVYIQRGTPPAPASLTINTAPPGIEVSIAGRVLGATPVTVSLPAGDHSVELSGPQGQQREFVVSLASGASVVQHLEMAAPAAAILATGALQVRTEPAGQLVTVDDVEHGRAPVIVPSLPPGDHVVIVRGEHATTRRTVTIRAGETLSLVLSALEAPVSAGWLNLETSAELQLFVKGELIGTTATDRLVMTAGEHQIDMANDALGFRTTRRVSIVPGRTTTLRVEMPNGKLNINALPWADVWIGGERVGQTPIANLGRPIGEHEVVFRHPQFGERRAMVVVSLKQTARLGVDMRQP